MNEINRNNSIEVVGYRLDSLEACYIRSIRDPLQKIPPDYWAVRLSFLAPILNNCFLEAKLSECNTKEVSFQKISLTYEYGILGIVAALIQTIFMAILIASSTRVGEPSDFLPSLALLIHIWSLLHFAVHLPEIIEQGNESREIKEDLKHLQELNERDEEQTKALDEMLREARLLNSSSSTNNADSTAN